MYNDLKIIKEKLMADVVIKFGDQIKDNINLLIDNLSGKDTFIDTHLFINLQNIMSLQTQDANYFIELALLLSSASAFAPVLLLEKIPTLTFYGVTDEVGKLLSNIKNYGARAVSLYLGSDHLKTEDLIDVLEQSNIYFYKQLLQSVNERHPELGIACSFIMRYSAKIESVISTDEINKYLDVCSVIAKRYGPKLTEQYIKNLEELIGFIPLTDHIKIIEDWANKSLSAAEFVVTYPSIAYAPSMEKPIKVENTKVVKIKVLESENYKIALDNPHLFEDKDFSALLLVWPTASQPLKMNVLFQLASNNYKEYIQTHTEIKTEIDNINEVTNSNWLLPWTFSGEVIDLSYIRKRISSLLQNKKYFLLEAKTIVKKHPVIFDRSNAIYDNERVLTILNTLNQYCINETAHYELFLMAEFILGRRNGLKNLLSKTTLVIQTWNRDPWVDYGRSDELYSCTGIGDYNAGNAPGFLGDLNLNNLDIWSGEIKVGRIHLCLIKDTLNKPLLLLDCVDGTERIIASKKKFELIINAVLEYASWLGIEKIKINYDIDYNTTPKKFIAYVEKILDGKNKIDFYSRFLLINTTKTLLPYPCQTFLESFIKNQGGFTRGAVINTNARQLTDQENYILDEAI